MILDSARSEPGEGCDLVLLDLGLALRVMPSTCSVVEAEAQSLRTSRDLEAGFGILGYRAPEVHRREPYGLSVDVFAFGRVFYNLMSAIHQPLRASITPSRVWAQLLLATCPRGPRAGWSYERIFCEPPASSRWPVALSRLAISCLSRDPSARPSAKAVSRILMEYMEGLV